MTGNGDGGEIDACARGAPEPSASSGQFTGRLPEHVKFRNEATALITEPSKGKRGRPPGRGQIQYGTLPDYTGQFRLIKPNASARFSNRPVRLVARPTKISFRDETSAVMKAYGGVEQRFVPIGESESELQESHAVPPAVSFFGSSAGAHSLGGMARPFRNIKPKKLSLTFVDETKAIEATYGPQQLPPSIAGSSGYGYFPIVQIAGYGFQPPRFPDAFRNELNIAERDIGAGHRAPDQGSVREEAPDRDQRQFRWLIATDARDGVADSATGRMRFREQDDPTELTPELRREPLVRQGLSLQDKAMAAGVSRAGRGTPAVPAKKGRRRRVSQSTLPFTTTKQLDGAAEGTGCQMPALGRPLSQMCPEVPLREGAEGSSSSSRPIERAEKNSRAGGKAMPAWTDLPQMNERVTPAGRSGQGEMVHSVVARHANSLDLEPVDTGERAHPFAKHPNRAGESPQTVVAALEEARPIERSKRLMSSGQNLPSRKRLRTRTRVSKTVEEQALDLAMIMRHLDDQHALKESLSTNRTWCIPVPHERRVSTAREFYRAFHDKSTLPIQTCTVCYRKRTEEELRSLSWDEWVSMRLAGRSRPPYTCARCFPEGVPVAICGDCARHLARGSLSPAAQLHCRLGCEHMFPEELKGLSPVEEKLIALNSCYGIFTRHAVVPSGQRQTVRYPKHIKGHVTVFPNNVQELATSVLPHPLVQIMEEIHVSWQGPEKPTPRDLSALLSVRRRVVERALDWLRANNPHYAHIKIDKAEMNSWGEPVDGVPALVYDRLERCEPSAWEKTRTGHVVPATERGMDDAGAVEIEDILASLDGEREPNSVGGGTESCRAVPDGGTSGGNSSSAGSTEPVISEVTSSGMFALDGVPDVGDAEKLRFACEAIGGTAGCGDRGPRATVQTPGEGASGPGDGQEAFIRVSRGDDFADSSETAFFAKTFPTLFPFGVGGPRLAEEGMQDAAGAAGSAAVSHARVAEADAAAGALVASRNLHLRAWADIVLRRHGGRFATHPIFSFLVFNMGVRSRNRRVSMLSVTRKNFRKVERIVRSMTAERLAQASMELEKTGKTGDDDVKELLRSLSLYGQRQPMSREVRLNMRRKIQSSIVCYGVPAIWFTLNPNDITNPVKLRLAAYRARDPVEAEAFLEGLGNAYKRTRLAISDPMSSAIFFHREMTLFFEKYVKAGEESVFGRISHYFGAVETNERGALHIHGLLWLHGNAQMASVLADVHGEDQTAYRERIIRYVDSVFCEVTRKREIIRVGSRALVAEGLLTRHCRSLTRKRFAPSRQSDQRRRISPPDWKTESDSRRHLTKKQISVPVPRRYTPTARLA